MLDFFDVVLMKTLFESVGCGSLRRVHDQTELLTLRTHLSFEGKLLEA